MENVRNKLLHKTIAVVLILRKDSAIKGILIEIVDPTFNSCKQTAQTYYNDSGYTQ
jgi:hypothetical protein